jgi:HNH endonuclease
MNLSLPCDPWPGALDKDGYGRIQIGPRGDFHAYRVCRLLITEWFGTVLPRNWEPDHLCGNPSCWEPAHLEPVTGTVNRMRSTNPAALNARKTHCVAGHPFDEQNTYHARGRRYCRACARAYQRAR